MREPAGQVGSGSSGSQLKRQPSTTLMLGITSASARTMVVFAVPFSPRTSTPPTSGDHGGQDQTPAPCRGSRRRRSNGNVLTSTPFLRRIHARGMLGRAGVRGRRQRPATADVLTSRAYLLS